jgi:hypothetical protein
MTIIFSGHEWGRKRRTSAPKPAVQYQEPERFHTLQANSNLHQEVYARPIPTIAHPDDHGIASAQRHPVYGAMPQMPDPPSQQHMIDSTAELSPPRLSPPTDNQNLLSAQWNRAGRLASRSCENLSNQISTGANRSAALVGKSVDLTNKSVSTITTYGIVKPTCLVTKKSVQAMNQTAALCDRISDKFDAVITSIDGGVFSGDEKDLCVYDDGDDVAHPSTSNPQPPGVARDRKASHRQQSSNTDKGSNFFSKVWLYSNARLPPHLPPFKVYVPTYPLLCLAATYSERAYEPATPSTSETHIPADWRSGTKAMVLGTGRQVSGLMSSSCAPIHGR